jgi:hypothetical protein
MGWAFIVISQPSKTNLDNMWHNCCRLELLLWPYARNVTAIHQVNLAESSKLEFLPRGNKW